MADILSISVKLGLGLPHVIGCGENVPVGGSAAMRLLCCAAGWRTAYM
jgi:hypothetical protein